MKKVNFAQNLGCGYNFPIEKFCPNCGCKISNNKSNVDDLFKIDSTIDNKINKCDDVAYKLIEEKSILDRLLGDINNSSAKLNQTSNSISRAINALKGLNTKASDSLSKAKNCVNSYLSVSIK